MEYTLTKERVLFIVKYNTFAYTFKYLHLQPRKEMLEEIKAAKQSPSDWKLTFEGCHGVSGMSIEYNECNENDFKVTLESDAGYMSCSMKCNTETVDGLLMALEEFYINMPPMPTKYNSAK